jgi:hypothetical protein
MRNTQLLAGFIESLDFLLCFLPVEILPRLGDVGMLAVEARPVM